MKRKSSQEDVGSPAATISTKVHSFFAPKSSKPTIAWQEHEESVLVGTSSMRGSTPTALTKLAMFDLDHTIIKPTPGPKGDRKYSKGSVDWQFLYQSIPLKLKKLHESGYRILFISNQNGLNGDIRVATFKQKLSNIAQTLDFPFVIYAAMKKDGYRKPRTGMFEIHVDRHHAQDVVEMSSSFYVGDAAGRPAGWKPNAPKDHADSDLKFALNLGIPFFTPEEYFVNEQVPTPVSFSFDPRTYKAEGLALFSPTNTPFVQSSTPEIIVNVGYPGSGKTRIAEKYLIPKGYVHINQDLIGSRDKCLAECTKAIKNKKSCVIDNTNPAKSTRALYIKLAKENGFRIRCFWHQADFDLAMHNNLFRQIVERGREIPVVAFNTFRSSFEEPCETEGFDEIKRINFLPSFEDEEQEIKWRRFL